MSEKPGKLSVADILGPWVQPKWESGLIARCREAWSKPIEQLTNEELATLLRQRCAMEHLLPIAERSVRDNVDDDTEMFEGELHEAIELAKKSV